MKQFSNATRRFIETGTGLGVNDKDRVVVERYADEVDALITSNEFVEKFKNYVLDFGVRKEVSDNGRKKMSYRSTDYASIGIMDRNDLAQEAYLGFLEAYAKYKESREKFENEAAVWSYLKKSTLLNITRSIREKKDGVRITEWGLFNKKGADGLQSITSLFHKLDEMFMKNYEDVVTSKWETDLLGYFLEVHMDEVLDLTFKGERNLKGIERSLIRGVFGIDEETKSFKELEDIFQVNASTLRKVKQRAIEKLKSSESMEKIANFVKEYRITTDSWARDWENNEDFMKKLEDSCHETKETTLILSDSEAKSYISKYLYKSSMKVLKASKNKDYKFSKGEDISERDLEEIRNRSKYTKVVNYKQGVFTPEGEDDLEDMFMTYNYKANLNKRAYADDDMDSFKIGNNLKGGI